MMRLASVFFGLLAIVLCGLGAYLYVTDVAEPPPGEALIVEAAERDLGSQPVGTEIPLRFRLTNKSSQPIRILGLAEG